MSGTTGWLTLAIALLGRQAVGQERVDEHWALDPNGAIRITCPFGKIRVRGWDAETLAVTGQLERGAGRLSATGDAHVRTIEATGPADLEVHVPRALTVWVTTTGADIDVVGVDGKLDLTSVAGAIHVVGTPQDVTAETMNGSVELAGGTGRARVKTVSGDVLLRGASQDLGASTLSGRIVVRAAGWQRGGTGVQRGKFESVTGDVRFEGELGRGGVVEVESQSGTIEVRALDLDRAARQPVRPVDARRVSAGALLPSRHRDGVHRDRHRRRDGERRAAVAQAGLRRDVTRGCLRAEAYLAQRGDLDARDQSQPGPG